MTMTLDTHTQAALTMVGMTLDSVGGLYLAYDLLGGEDGPLSKLTRFVNYTIMLFAIFILSGDFRFALIGSVGMGLASALHMQRISHGQKETPLFLLFVGVVRGLTVFFAASDVVSPATGVIAGVGIFLISVILPLKGISPKIWYQPGIKPTFTLRKIQFSIGLGSIITLLLVLGSFLGHNAHSTYAAAKCAVLVTAGIVLLTIFGPTIEWWADNVPDKRMGYLGAIMFLLGFMVQAIPSLITLLRL